MKKVTVSSQRQITLPKDMLQQLHVESGMKLLLRIEQDRLVLEKDTSLVDRLGGGLAKYADREALETPFKEAEEQALQSFAEDNAS